MPADDSHEISCLICIFERATKPFEIVSITCKNYRWRFKGYFSQHMRFLYFLHQIKASQFHTSFLMINFFIITVWNFSSRILMCKLYFFIIIENHRSPLDVLEKSLNFTQACPYNRLTGFLVVMPIYNSTLL